MKATMTSQVTDRMFWLDKYAETTIVSNNAIKKRSIQFDSQTPIIESIIESIVEPIIYKC